MEYISSTPQQTPEPECQHIIRLLASPTQYIYSPLTPAQLGLNFISHQYHLPTVFGQKTFTLPLPQSPPFVTNHEPYQHLTIITSFDHAGEESGAQVIDAYDALLFSPFNNDNAFATPPLHRKTIDKLGLRLKNISKEKADRSRRQRKNRSKRRKMLHMSPPPSPLPPNLPAASSVFEELRSPMLHTQYKDLCNLGCEPCRSKPYEPAALTRKKSERKANEIHRVDAVFAGEEVQSLRSVPNPDNYDYYEKSNYDNDAGMQEYEDLQKDKREKEQNHKQNIHKIDLHLLR